MSGVTDPSAYSGSCINVELLDLEHAVYVLKVGSASEGVELNFGAGGRQRTHPCSATCCEIDCK